MVDAELLKSIASQLMTKTSVSVDGQSVPVRGTRRQHLKTAAFNVGGHEYQAIEQNPEKPMGPTGTERSSSCAIQRCRDQ